MSAPAHDPHAHPPRSRERLEDASRHLPSARPFPQKQAQGLATALSRVIGGEVRFSDGDRALYATDGSNYRQVPIGVVIPRSAEDVVRTLAVCRNHGAPVLSRGGGTSLAGQCCNVAVVMDFSKYLHRVLSIDAGKRLARVEPGAVLDDLRRAAERHHLTFGPDPSTHDHCTLGGMIGNNSCGVHSVMAGRTADNVHELEVVTYDGLRMRVGATPEHEIDRIVAEGGRRGQIYARLRDLRDRYADLVRARFPRIPRRVSGYNLDELLPENGFHVARALTGTESTCVTILEATVRLVPSPRSRSLLVLGYPDVYSAGDHVPEVMAAGPIGCEGLDDILVGYMKKIGLHPQDVTLLPPGNGWLMVEFGGDTREESDARANDLIEQLKRAPNPPSFKLFDDPEEERTLWRVRESGLGATAHVPGEPVTWEGWEDSAVPPERMGEYLRRFRSLLQKYGYGCALYGHFGQGCLHTRIDFDLATKHGIEHYDAFINEAADLVVSFGGSLSGEHGDGQSRAALLPKMFGPELVQAFREFKAIWDPDGRMNPGKVVDAYLPTQNLRLGVGYDPPVPETYFRYPDDQGNFGRAMLRCVGVGECRRAGGFMCPSYHATREEKHSTRGRARLLWELLNGDVIGPGRDRHRMRWREDAVRDALDLCLSCKGCKADCPVKVDMATYKAEFMAHYYKGRLRPRNAYAFGLIGTWARLGSAVPALANFATTAPLLSSLSKWMADATPERPLPRFAAQSFTRWFAARGPRPRAGARRLLLWPDVFNDAFYPETLRDAVEALEALGFGVELPPFRVPTVRPMLDYGFLDHARRDLKRVVERLDDIIGDEVPVVCLEPSVVALYRDELLNLFPRDLDAGRLSSHFLTFGELLAREDVPLPRLPGPALLHVHCHEKAVMKPTAVNSVLDRLGIEAEQAEIGCCGMAGAFGFERSHYQVSMSIAERALLPAVRRAPDDALLIADGFSCRTQILDATGRMPLHLAQVVRKAMG